MRERLIELIGSKVCGEYSQTCDEWEPHSCEKCYANDCKIGELADCLLADGWMRSPCKVGDTVYIVDGSSDDVVEGVITNFEYNLYTTPREWITVKGNYPFFGWLETKNRIDLLLGKTVFLTRKEAEAVLKGGAE